MGVEEQENEHVIPPVSDYLGVLARLRWKAERVWQERFLDGLESAANTLIHLSSPRSVPGGTPLRLSYLYKQSRGRRVGGGGGGGAGAARTLQFCNLQTDAFLSLNVGKKLQ